MNTYWKTKDGRDYEYTSMERFGIKLKDIFLSTVYCSFIECLFYKWTIIN